MTGPVHPSGLRHREMLSGSPGLSLDHTPVTNSPDPTPGGRRGHLEPPVMGALGGWDPDLTPDMRDRARMGSPEPLREAEGKSWREEGKRCSCGARIASTGHIFLQGRTFPARTSKAQSCNEGRPAGQQCNAQRVGGQSFHKNLILPPGSSNRC